MHKNDQTPEREYVLFFFAGFVPRKFWLPFLSDMGFQKVELERAGSARGGGADRTHAWILGEYKFGNGGFCFENFARLFLGLIFPVIIYRYV